MDSDYFAAPVPHPAFAPAAAPGAVAPQVTPTNPPRVGRFAKTEVSFGLTGRIVLTVLLLLPLLWFGFLAIHYFIGIGGLVVYGGAIVPWALRDLWRHPNHR